jgi:aminoglycoside 3-N-acetyltransferase
MSRRYSFSDIEHALEESGIRAGDVVYSHLSLLNLGLPDKNISPKELVSRFISVVRRMLGPSGAFYTPCFTYSFCNGEIYDPKNSPSQTGAFAEVARHLNGVKRSDDPLFSVISLGENSRLIDTSVKTSFGEGSFFDRLINENAKVCNIGLDLNFLTPIHRLEKMIGVSYRYDKIFHGKRVLNGQEHELSWEYYVRDLSAPSFPDCSELQRLGIEQEIVQSASLGIGKVHCTPVPEYFELAKRCVKNDPWFLTHNAAWRNNTY